MGKVPTLLLGDADLCVGWNTDTPRRSARDWVDQAERQCEPPKESERRHEPWNQAQAEPRWWQPNHVEVNDSDVGVICPHKCELAFNDGDSSKEGWGKYKRGFVPSVELGAESRGRLNLFICLRDLQGSSLETGNDGLRRFKVSISKGPAEIISSTESLKHVDIAEVHFEVFLEATLPPSEGGIAFWLNVQDRVTGRHVRRSPRRVRAFWSTSLGRTDSEVFKCEHDTPAVKTAGSSSLTENASSTTVPRPGVSTWSQLLNAPQKTINKVQHRCPSSIVAAPTSSASSEPRRPEPKGVSPHHAAALQILGDLRGAYDSTSSSKAVPGKQDGLRETLPPVKSKSRHARCIEKQRHDPLQLLLSTFEKWADVCRRTGRIKDNDALKGFDSCLERLLEKATYTKSTPAGDANSTDVLVSHGCVEIQETLIQSSKRSDVDADMPPSTEVHCPRKFPEVVSNHEPEFSACIGDRNATSDVAQSAEMDGLPKEPVKNPTMDGELKKAVVMTKISEANAGKQPCSAGVDNKQDKEKTKHQRNVEGAATSCSQPENASCQAKAQAPQSSHGRAQAPQSSDVPQVAFAPARCDPSVAVKHSRTEATNSSQGLPIKPRQSGVARPLCSGLSVAMGVVGGSVKSGALSRMTLGTFPA